MMKKGTKGKATLNYELMYGIILPRRWIAGTVDYQMLMNEMAANAGTGSSVMRMGTTVQECSYYEPQGFVGTGQLYLLLLSVM